MRLSYSALSEYQTCALKYKFHNIDKIKEPKSAQQVFGTLVHSALQFAYSKAPLVPSLEEVLDVFTRGWNASLYESPDEERAAFSQGIAMLRRFYEDNDIATANVVALERRFQFDVGPEDNRHSVSGIIDRIDKTPEGYEIIDYKTGRTLPTQDQVDRDLQLTIYARAFLAMYPAERDNLRNLKVSLYFLKHGTKLTSTRTLEDLARVEEEVLAAVAAIEAEQFAPTVSPLCAWCAYQHLCPMQKHRFKDAAWDDDDVRKAIDELAALKKKMGEDRKKAAALQEKIRAFMDANDLGQAFGEHASVALSERTTHTYDPARVEALLAPLEKWRDVVRVDATALKRILPTLPPDVQREVEAARDTKTSTTLTLKKR